MNPRKRKNQSPEVGDEVANENNVIGCISEELQCNQCEMSFNSSATRRQHIYSNHTTVAVIDNYGASITVEMNENGELTCPICCNNFKGYKSFVNHVARQHPTLSKPQSLENKHSIEGFSFDEGCSSVLQGSNDKKKQKYGGLAKYHDFIPAKLLIKQSTSNVVGNTMYLPLFINSPSRNALNSFITSNEEFKARLVFSNTDSCDNTTTIAVPNNTSSNLSGFHSQVQNSRYPKVISVIGPFTELNEDLEEVLNFDFSRRKYLLPLIPDLFVGGIIHSRNFILMITTCELYVRDANLDEHLESNRSTFPYSLEAGSRRYKRILITITKQSDGGALINKLQIGTTQFNLLITGSLILYPHLSNTTSIGPGCNSFLVNEKMNENALLFSNNNVQKFMMRFSDSSNITLKEPNVEDVRQLTTLLQYSSTYLNYRSHLLEDRSLHPATIFTLSKYPTRNFSMSTTNQSRLLSEFFTICCECVLFHNSTITNDKIINLKNKLDNEENKESNSRLLGLVNDLTEYIQVCIKNETNCNILAFLNKRDKLSALSQTISSQLSATNKRIETILEIEMSRIFGSNNQ